MKKSNNIENRPEKLYERLLAHKDIDLPWHVYRILGVKSLSISGDQASLGYGDCDYATLPELRSCMEWIVDQLGGNIKWKE